MRWFSPWTQHRKTRDFHLPPNIQSITGQTTVAFGDGILNTPICKFGTELCEELFTPLSPHIDMSLCGVEVFTNGSASHHEFRKLERRVKLIEEAMAKCGGLYMYSNQQGNLFSYTCLPILSTLIPSNNKSYNWITLIWFTHDCYNPNLLSTKISKDAMENEYTTMAVH